MFKILKTIFGSGDVIEKGFELIDNMHTSDEEAIAARVKGKVDLLNAYSAFRLAQRLLAMMFALTFLGCFWLSVVMVLVYNSPVAQLMELLSLFYIGPIMLTIVTFYFGGGFLEGTIEKFKKKT
jgi:hypothetical protein